MTSSVPEVKTARGLLFLRHAGEDSKAARGLATLLRGAGLDVWLDIERLKPGDMWQRGISAALHQAQALVLYVGRSGVGRWVDFEVQIALDRSAKDRGFRVGVLQADRPPFLGLKAFDVMTPVVFFGRGKKPGIRSNANAGTG